MVATEEYPLLLLQARASASLADRQVVLLRDLAARLTSCGTPADYILRVHAAADQLEAAARETWRVVGSGQDRAR